MTHNSIEPRKIRKSVKGYDEFLSFARNLYNKFRKNSLDTSIKMGLNAGNTASKKLVHKTAEEATGELVTNKVIENIVRPKPMSDMNSRNVEKIIIPLYKRQEILKELGQVL